MKLFSNRTKGTISFLVGSTIFGAIIGFVFLGYLKISLPKVEGLSEFNPPISSRIYSKDEVVLLETGIEDRQLVPFNEIPSRIVEAFIAAEDSNFYNHSGVDYLGIARAMIANIQAGRFVQGGSTITQQVAKQLYLTRERTITRKLKDILLAIELEKKFNKEDILYLYLNQVYLGGGYYGVKSAFKGYFNKELEEVTVAEAALVAGLLVAPGRYSPYINPVFAKKRQNYVLSRLFDTQKITEEEYKKSLVEALRFRIRKGEPMKGGHFTEWIRKTIVNEVGEESFLRDGYQIKTTIDWSLQEKAEKFVSEGLKDIDKRQGYKGPLKHIEKDGGIEEFEVEQRTDFYKKHSNYFVLHPDGAKEYQIQYTQEEMEVIRSYEATTMTKSRFLKVYPDNASKSKDELHQFIYKGEIYEAVVKHVDRYQNLIYVSVGGIKGFIPKDGFSWARERVISEERNYIPLVSRASEVAKVGDVILVKTIAKKVSPYRYFDKNFVEKLKTSEQREKYQKQRFYKFYLEQEPEVEGALVAINPQSEEIVSLVGGGDFNKSQFNRAVQALRQPGSSFKPFLYAAALEHGYTPSSIIIDSPEALGGVDNSLNWKPRNYDGKFKGAMTLRRSLELSRNVTTIKMASDLGVDNILKFLDRIDLEAKLDPDLSLALGSFGISLLNLTANYALFPNGGKKINPKAIISVTDRYDKKYEITVFKKEEEIIEGENLESLNKKILLAPETETET